MTSSIKTNQRTQLVWVSNQTEARVDILSVQFCTVHIKEDLNTIPTLDNSPCQGITEFKEECVVGQYPPKGRPSVPTYTVNLDAPPEHRWAAVVKDKGPALAHLLKEFKKFFLAFGQVPKDIIGFVDKDLGFLADTLPAPYGQEIKGIANITGLPLGEVVMFNIFYEIFSACTSIVAENPQGKDALSRKEFGLCWQNHSWVVTEALRPMVINLNFERAGKIVFKSAGFAGYIGVITGMKPGLFTLTVNERFAVSGGYIGILQWILGNRSIQWMSFLTRQTLEKSVDYEDARTTLKEAKLLAPAYFIVGGNKTGQGCIITRSRTESVDVWDLGTRNSSWFLLETNYDHWKAPLFVDDRRTPGNRCMNKLGQKNVGFPGLFDVLSSRPVLNKLTAYTCLMQVNSGTLETYLQHCPDPCSPW
ncbi:hypothetical protein NP493_365g00072 [Ridgeia piscesae]|uniref:Acid ceramidase n=1 Tax=Ridgeia piscesae TaxID=27915 RepID=A0AAD9L455_RIDPI|nr:hypothetical protein NP493_365g00072 [Ridgeia piscesae]